jgi:hypothetical protein
MKYDYRGFAAIDAEKGQPNLGKNLSYCLLQVAYSLA